MQGLRVALLGASQASADLFNKLLNDTTFYEATVVNGNALGKKPGTIAPRQVRAITPLPNILVLFDCLVDIHVKRVVDSVASSVGWGYMEAAIRGRQILDVSFALSQHIAKALDDHSQGCIATADIAAFFDNLDPLKVCRWLQAKDYHLHCALRCYDSMNSPDAVSVSAVFRATLLQGRVGF